LLGFETFVCLIGVQGGGGYSAGQNDAGENANEETEQPIHETSSQKKGTTKLVKGHEVTRELPKEKVPDSHHGNCHQNGKAIGPVERLESRTKIVLALLFASHPAPPLFVSKELPKRKLV